MLTKNDTKMLEQLKLRVRGQLAEVLSTAIVIGVMQDPDDPERLHPFGLAFPLPELYSELSNGDEREYIGGRIANLAEPVREILGTVIGNPGHPDARELRLIASALWLGLNDIMTMLLEEAQEEEIG